MHFLKRAIFALSLTAVALSSGRADDADIAPACLRIGEICADATAFEGCSRDNYIVTSPDESPTTPTPIPEPAGVGVLVAALAAACAALRVRAKRARSQGKTALKPPAKTP